jgi:hypothetical protein
VRSNSSLAARNQKSYRILLGVIALLGAGLLVYANTDAFAWDEGFHTLTAQLITRGKRPWIDFNFSQTPLNAYWNAFWMIVFGQSWHVTHTVAAMMTIAATLLITDYVFIRFPIEQCRFPAALMTAVVFGLNVHVVQYGSIGQAYGLALFLVVAAFRISVAAVNRDSVALAAAAGLLSAAAAGCTQLTSPVCPILAVWIVLQNRAGSRWTKLAGFVLGALIPMIPIAWLFAEAPGQAFFNIIQYNLLFRQVEWSGAIEHDIGVMLSWLHSAQGLLVGLLALAGILSARKFALPKFPKFAQPELSEFNLCGWLALGLCIFISNAHPTFARYYLFALPFLTVLAAAGMYVVSTRLLGPDKTFWPLLALTLIFSLELGKALYDKHDNVNWRDLAKVAAKVDQVTPPGVPVLADEPIYFLTKRPPPSGMELADSHKLDFPPERAAPLHLISESEIIRRMDAGAYPTAVDCGKGHKVTEDEFKKVYASKEEGDTCTVYWNFRR